MKSINKTTGYNAELIAKNYLEQQGLKLVQQNFYSRFGEIDLIMQENDTLIFVEVKKRKTGIDNALESITKAKQNKMVLTARYYLLKKTSQNFNCRFDAIAIDGNNKILWLKNVIIL